MHFQLFSILDLYGDSRIRGRLRYLFLVRLIFMQRGESEMDFLNGKIKPMYFKYLSAAFGSAMITSVYSIVDTAMVGQYHGPEGTAALAVVAPVWNIIYSLGLLMGIGGSVIFSMRRGLETNDGSENQYFTAAVIGAVILSVLAWIGVICFERPVLTFFGADESLLVLAQHQRPFNPAAGPDRSGFPVVRHARHRAAGYDLCSYGDSKIYKGSALKRKWTYPGECPSVPKKTLLWII